MSGSGVAVRRSGDPTSVPPGPANLKFETYHYVAIVQEQERVCVCSACSATSACYLPALQGGGPSTQIIILKLMAMLESYSTSPSSVAPP